MLRAKNQLALMGLAIAVVAITLLSPQRHVSGDTVPGRWGALVLACGGQFDLARADWIARLDPPPYWAHRTDDGLVSVYGPMPAIVGSAAMLGVDEIDDAGMRTRERIVAALLLALSTVLLALAALARRSLRASIGIAAIAALSFAGAATLGQGLWQQTVALPALTAALAMLAWSDRKPRLHLMTPAMLLLAVLLRPTLAPLAVGLGIAWCLTRPPWQVVRAAAIIAVLVTAPLWSWHLVYTGSPLPTGQLAANAAVSDDVFVVSRAQLGYGLGGLLVSPARGLLWFAPIVLAGVVLAFRRKTDRAFAGAILAQILVVACFHMWWGGISYGPRFLVEATWVGIWLALTGPIHRAVWIPAVAVTVLVGQLGLWLWRAEQWETRRSPDIDQNALWDFADSPIPSTLRAIHDQPFASDAMAAPQRVVCKAGRLHSLP